MSELGRPVRVSVAGATIELVTGDITEQDTDAIVNAANTRLAGGGGVDGAIHRAAGPSVMAELRQRYPEGCPTGEAVITSGGRLAAAHVIHAVGPVYSGRPQDAQRLASAFRASMRLCFAHGVRSVSFPSISTGAYRYPVEQAAAIAVRTVREELAANPGRLEMVRFVLFDLDTCSAYRRALEASVQGAEQSEEDS